MTKDFRPIAAPDLPALKTIIASSNLFPPAMLDDMLAPYLAGEDEHAIWITDTTLSTIAYCVPEMMTEGTWNLLLLAVHADRHGEGFGTEMIQRLESALKHRNARLLIVETSGTPEFKTARAFYAARGFEREAVIREFYGPGDDKVVFAMKL